MERTEHTERESSQRQAREMADSPNGVAPASDSGVESLGAALRVALQEQLHAQLLGRSPDGRLRHAIRLICESAHQQHLYVEHVVVMVKQAWHSLPEVRQLPSSGIAADLLGRVVSLTIEEFYAGQGRRA